MRTREEILEEAKLGTVDKVVEIVSGISDLEVKIDTRDILHEIQIEIQKLRKLIELPSSKTIDFSREDIED